ncbi:MAG: hypothetical protein COW18_07320 [Zetaproteobacteria bacterium CG12_big_fil_rev_8_21_14_0_65_54_13]|nr:MAG: hypothetical protein COW18_07320 [Zetaproteobacteria bacterium CG12_big_fil_rev_8_21_14_0_65_54_13]PIX53663.1 MAG: hypothetical protein COZ50_12375 [Zetaproteobacteria bacterium CG_4_10_14_3_um_filter_54_28]PJA27879.1 MAG: hypothetical protein CO188_10985 [Zetaproteobacteria bacterium CG_4_9_14_3_um_filter_54_145]
MGGRLMAPVTAAIGNKPATATDKLIGNPVIVTMQIDPAHRIICFVLYLNDPAVVRHRSFKLSRRRCSRQTNHGNE